MRRVVNWLAVIVGLLVISARGDSTGIGAVSEASAGRSGQAVVVDDFVLSYSVTGDTLAVTLTYPTTGWVAIGFKPSMMMKAANIVIGYASDNGSSKVEDHYGVSATRHKPDIEEGGTADVVGGSCEEKDGTTTMRFRMPLDSGDSKDCVLHAGEQIPVVLAAGRRDSFGKHREVAATTIQF